MKNEIPKELLDQLLAGRTNPEEFQGFLKQLTGALVERMLSAELTHHLGYEPHAVEGRKSGNSRNGSGQKTLATEHGEVTIAVPRDRNGTFEPKLVKKHQTRFTGFDDKILSLYARGMSARDIQSHLSEMYGTEIAPSLISEVTDAVVEEIAAWQSRPLDPVWPFVFLDALIIKVRDQGTVQNKAVYIALGVGLDGRKEILGLWLESTEGARFWLKVITELKNRGVQDILIACCDGLKGFPQAIEAVFPKTIVQTCIVHLVRSSTRFVTWKDRKAIMPSLRSIYAAPTEAAGLKAIEAFEAGWPRYAVVAKAWRSNWEVVRPFFAFSAQVRRLIYTTNAIESLNFQLRKVIKAKGHFPNDEAATKLLYLALRNVEKKWQRPPTYWKAVLNELVIHFEGRLPV